MSGDRTELRRRVAREVLGWTAKDIPWAYSGTTSVWHRDGDVLVITEHAWRPDEDDRQCMEVLDALAADGFDYVVGREDGACIAVVGRAGEHRARAEHPERRVAVLEAALAAVSR